MLYKMLVVALIAVAISFEVTVGIAAGLEQHGYPRIMGMNISRPAYYDTPEYQNTLGKLDIVILGFWEGWGKSKKTITEGEVVRRIKRINPKALVGQYTILNEWKDINEPSNARLEVSKKIDSENWWLRDAKGKRTQWTDEYRAWDINITMWTRADRNGERYPEWLAKKDYESYFGPVPEFDIWYLDNALSRPAVKKADWDADGEDDSFDDPRIAKAYRIGNLDYLNKARQLLPRAVFIGNSDDLSSPEYSQKFQGVFMEAVIGASWSMERWKGWEAVMERYRAAIKHTTAPHIVAFNVRGNKHDYQRMRYGLTSCLLDDGYFSYSDEILRYGSVEWFGEYDVELGKPIDDPQLQPWMNGVYRRRFENGLVLVNPGVEPKAVVVQAGYRRFNGNQVPDVNNGAAVTAITIRGKDGIILLRE